MSSTHQPLVFSGMQPTNTLHLGNYLGALKNWVKLQDKMPCIYCVVDMHAITAVGYGKPEELRTAVREVAAAYIAAGVDPSRSVLFAQSAVPAHAELAWIFNCVARLGWADRMTQFKEKAGKHKERASVGLYTYPMLMAADILVYKATHVPVGEDQKQHLELTRDVAQKFNNDFNVPDFFPLTEPVIMGAGTRVMSLRDGSKKMSKSDDSDMSRINLTDDADAVAQKIRKARTDPNPLPEDEKGLEGRPEADNLINIFAALSDTSKAEVVARFAGQQFSGFKNELADLAVAKIAPIATRMRELLTDPVELDRILKDGAEKAAAIAAPVIAEAKKIVGFSH
ncbi:tryptophan--tRNA ligase [Rhizomicrobium electricum]|uniref:Tryptophan--tRNA ligase n=1 Tax=Rhizomicrobium electricum TaxID=480070 RepID=A0ABP3PLL6_9PROT|nr:tryptophan--tRNA ligase [Rhizomicrobium electricum]NIJ48330.1 tryptophanyl-tRNA synthetase [Rhizomicrobium electricum]